MIYTSGSDILLTGNGILALPQTDPTKLQLIMVRASNFGVFTYKNNGIYHWATEISEDYKSLHAVFKSDMDAFYLFRAAKEDPYDLMIQKFTGDALRDGTRTLSYEASWGDNTDWTNNVGGRADVYYDRDDGLEKWYTCASQRYTSEGDAGSYQVDLAAITFFDDALTCDGKGADCMRFTIDFWAKCLAITAVDE